MASYLSNVRRWESILILDVDIGSHVHQLLAPGQISWKSIMFTQTRLLQSILTFTSTLSCVKIKIQNCLILEEESKDIQAYLPSFAAWWSCVQPVSSFLSASSEEMKPIVSSLKLMMIFLTPISANSGWTPSNFPLMVKYLKYFEPQNCSIIMLKYWILFYPRIWTYRNIVIQNRFTPICSICQWRKHIDTTVT